MTRRKDNDEGPSVGSLPKHNCRHFADDIFQYIFLKENVPPMVALFNDA